MPKKDTAIAPQDDETYEDFLDRCLEETDGDNFTCDLAWEERSVKKKVEVLGGGAEDPRHRGRRSDLRAVRRDA